jgi:putative ABC transport system permease protein
MLDLAIKDLKEHRVRTILTVLGIIIAITAIISLGSISAGVNELITSTTSGVGSDTIFVMKNFDFSQMSGPPTALEVENIDEEELESIRSIAGVKRVVPIISKTAPGMFGEVDAIDMDDLDVFGAQDLTLKEGYWPDNNEQGVVMGYVAASMMGVTVGDYITLNKKQVEVLGIAEEGQGSYDLVILMPYKYGEEIYDMEGEANQVAIEPQDPSLVNEIKNAIEEEHDDLMAMTMEDALKMAQEMTATLSVMTLGIGFVASLVAGIGIVITMYSSVLERRREIGILKAVGAFRRTIFKQILEEGLLLSVLGSLTGLLLSFFFVDALNNVLLGGVRLAVITPLLAGGAVAYGILLTLVFSLYPAWIAVKTDPIDAIRKG